MDAGRTVVAVRDLKNQQGASTRVSHSRVRGRCGEASIPASHFVSAPVNLPGPPLATSPGWSMRGSIERMNEPTQKYSITMPRDIAEAARTRSGPSGLSAYVVAAVARQIERDNLNELISVAEADHGAITEEEIQARRDQLHRAREAQRQTGNSGNTGSPGASAA